jgi:hypothetical protein
MRTMRLVTLWYLILLIALGFGLRVVELNSLPQSLSANEAIDGVDGLHLFRTHQLTPFLSDDSGRETLFFYVQSAALWLYGISFFSLRFSGGRHADHTALILFGATAQARESAYAQAAAPDHNRAAGGDRPDRGLLASLF